MIQVLEGNVLVPMVMKSTIGVPPFLVVSSLVVGAAAGGLIGALLAVPLVAAMVVILEHAQDRQTMVKLESGASSSSEDDAGETEGPAVDPQQPNAEQPARPSA